MCPWVDSPRWADGALMRDAFLEVQHLTKHFPLNDDILSRLTGKTRTLKAVDDISFCIQPGETLGLVGESGCGKSTTARLITRLIEPSSGDILLKGENLLTLPSSRMLAMRKTIQLVFQDPYSSLNPRKPPPRLTLQGEVGKPVEPPPGCRLYGRCPLATEVCSQIAPPLSDRGSGHFVACHNV